MRTFSWLWFGELISLVGSQITSLALGVWLYQETGSVLNVALTLLALKLPAFVLAPVAGEWVDRWSVRRTMWVADVLAAGSTAVLGLFIFSGRLELWHIYLFQLGNATTHIFQDVAYQVAAARLVPQAHLGRASGMMHLAEAVAQILAPAASGVLFLTIGLEGIVLLDLATFLVAIIILLLITIPPAAQTNPTRLPWTQSIGEGGRFVRQQAGLVGLLLFVAGNNLLLGVYDTLLTPLALQMGNALSLGFVLAAGGVGMLLGSGWMSLGGRLPSHFHGAIGLRVAFAFCFIGAGLYPAGWSLALTHFVYCATLAIAMSSLQAIWLAKVPAHLQGRVVAVRRMVAFSTLPISYLLTGWLADAILEPINPTTSAGAGLGWLLVGVGLLLLALIGLAYLYPPLRQVEQLTPLPKTS